MEEKKTEMVLKVDLQCHCCYRKVKKILCKYPEIRDQRYDEKTNTVSIIVLTCCPEKIRDKLCYGGGKVIKSIDIKEHPKPKPDKPKEQEKPKVLEKPKDLEKPKESEKPKVQEKPKEPEKPKVQEKPKAPEKPKVQEKPKEVPIEKPKEAAKPKEQEKPKSDDKPKEQEKPKPAPEKPAEPKAHPPPTAAPPPMLQPMPGMVAVHAAQGYPPLVETGYIFMPSYGESYYDGHGPTYHEYAMPIVAAPTPPSFDYYDQNYGGYGKPAFVHRDDEYYTEEDSEGCSIM